MSFDNNAGENHRSTRGKKHARRRRIAHQHRNYVKLGVVLLLVSAFSSYCMAPDSQNRSGDRAHTDHGASYRSLQNSDAAATNRETKTEQSATRSMRLRPANHDVAWMERHAAVSRSNFSECASCHQEEDCVACHTAELAEPFQIHPPNFTVIHAVDAKLSPQNCTSCHQTQTFCTECHMRSGVSAIDGFEPPVRAEFHPPGWLEPSQPNNHGVAARRNITDCASCHQERDCVTCHVNINPHPPEFQLNCRNWIKADPRPCAECHGDLGAIKQLCL